MKKRNKKFKQGIYTPENSDKFILSEESLGGPYIIYRSSWEKKFLYWADRNPNVIKIFSEFPIKYYFELDGKYHKYYVDFLMEVKQEDKIQKYLIEIKPYSEYCDVINGVKKKGRMKESTFLRRVKTAMKNKAKWEAAVEFAKENDMIFKVLTEKELFD